MRSLSKPGAVATLPVERHVQIRQHHVQRGLAVQPGDYIGFAGGDFVVGRDRLAALRDARHQRHAARGIARKRDATQAAMKDSTGRSLALDIAMAAERKLHGL